MVDPESLSHKRSYYSITNSISNLSLSSILPRKKRKVSGRDNNNLTSLEVLDAESVNIYYYSPSKQGGNISSDFKMNFDPDSTNECKPKDSLQDSTIIRGNKWSINDSSDPSKDRLITPKSPPISPNKSSGSTKDSSPYKKHAKNRFFKSKYTKQLYNNHRQEEIGNSDKK